MDKNTQQNEPEQNSQQTKLPDVWQVLEERKRKGLWKGEIDIIPIKEYNLRSGNHYFVITDHRKAEVTCTSCPIKHGGFLEHHMLTRYEVKNGIIYLDGKAMTKTASEMVVDNQQ